MSCSFDELVYKLEKKSKIRRQKYYEGFKVAREKKMFEQEILDAKLAYEKQKEAANENIDYIKSCLIHYMKIFIENDEKIQEADRKLASLDYKLKNQDEEED